MPDREDLYRIFAPHEQGYRSCQPPSKFLGPLVLPPPGRELGIPTPESDALSNALRRCPLRDDYSFMRALQSVGWRENVRTPSSYI